MRIDNFRNYDLYRCSLDLTQSIYKLMDKENFFSSHERREFHKIAIAVPKLIASGIGQSNMKIRFKQLNKMKDCLLELKHLSNSSHLIESKGYGYLLNEIENNRLQVLKLLHGYFGWLKRSKKKE